MKNYTDKIISDSLGSKDDIPKELGSRIISTVNNLYDSDQEKANKKSYNKYYKLIAGLCASIFITTGIVFAKDYLKSIFNLGEHGYGEQQLQEAINNNYIQYSNDKYIEENGVKYKLEHSLLNDINLIFSIDFVTNFNIDKFEDLSISGLEIKDENNNQIHIDSEEQNIWKNNIAQSMRFTKIQKSNNEISVAFTLVSNQFPKINTLYISFDKITLYTVDKGIVNKKELNGNYNLQLDIDNKFNDRDTTNYVFKTISNDININLEKVISTNTGLGITFNSSDYECFGYKFQLLDNNHNELYSKKNDINTIKDSNSYFAWIDINDDVKNLDSFILQITNIDGKVSSFIINKKL